MGEKILIMKTLNVIFHYLLVLYQAFWSMLPLQVAYFFS